MRIHGAEYFKVIDAQQAKIINNYENAKEQKFSVMMVNVTPKNVGEIQ